MWPYIDQTREGVAISRASTIGTVLAGPFVSLTPPSAGGEPAPANDRLPLAHQAVAERHGAPAQTRPASNDDTGSVRGSVRALGRSITAWLRRREMERTLLGMDDHQLADIGLTRADIGDVVAGRRHRPARTR